jgi:hypothetical protein
MFWAFLGLLGTICLAVLSLLLWPIRMLIRKIRGEQPAHEEETTADAPPADVPPVDVSPVDVSPADGPPAVTQSTESTSETR